LTKVVSAKISVNDYGSVDIDKNTYTPKSSTGMDITETNHVTYNSNLTRNIRIGKYITYSNPSTNVSILHPVNWLWIPLDNETFKFDIPPVAVQDDIPGRIILHSEATGNTKNSTLLLNETTNKLIKFNKDTYESYGLHAIKPITLNGLPAKMISYSYPHSKFGDFTGMDVVAISGEREYLISYVATT